jgi:predicted small secreted protein
MKKLASRAFCRMIRHRHFERELKMLRKAVLAAVLLSTGLVLTGCNTVKGLGRDIESVGEAGDRAI